DLEKPANGSAKAAAVASCAWFAVTLVAGCQRVASPPEPPPPTVSISQPVHRQVPDWDDYAGRFEAVESVEVRPRVSGLLESVNFRDGENVRKGQLLFVIDPR